MVEAFDPYRNVTEEQWEARESVRQLLENTLSRQVNRFEAQPRGLTRQCLSGPSVYERGTEIVPARPNTPLTLRMENANFRRVAPMTA
jgi:hypothetical protein